MSRHVFRAGRDPLLPPGDPVRVRFVDGAFLTESDFQAEQLYHRGHLARALAYLHGAGTIAGLDVDIAPPGGSDAEIVVQPGLALDRLGRLIELPVEQCLRIGPWLEDQGREETTATLLRSAFREDDGTLGAHVVADVFIAFHACLQRPAPAFSRGLQDPLDAVQPSRVQDVAALGLVLRRAAIGPDEALPRPRAADLEGLDEAARIEALHHFKRTRLWQELRPEPGSVPPELPRPEGSHEYEDGMERSEVMLARLRLPVRRADPLDVPVHDPDQAIGAQHVRNEVRLFSYGAAELALLLGL